MEVILEGLYSYNVVLLVSALKLLVLADDDHVARGLAAKPSETTLYYHVLFNSWHWLNSN